MINNLVQKIGPNLEGGNKYGLSQETLNYFKDIDQKDESLLPSL